MFILSLNRLFRFFRFRKRTIIRLERLPVLRTARVPTFLIVRSVRSHEKTIVPQERRPALTRTGERRKLFILIPKHDIQ